MKRRRIPNAVRFPVFLLAWTAGVVLATLQLQPADSTAVVSAGATTLWEPSAGRGHAVVAEVGLAPGVGTGSNELPWKRPNLLRLGTDGATSWRPPSETRIRELRSRSRQTPVLDDRKAWSRAMADLARRSEVMNGSWQPPDRSVPRIHPVATVAPAEVAPDAAAASAVAGADEIAERAVDVEPAAEVATAVSVEPSAAVAPPAPAAKVVKSAAARFIRFGADKSRARDALRGGRFAEAYALLRPRVGEARHDSEYLGLLALAAMRLGSHGEAMVLYQRLAVMEPASGRWRMGVALAQESLGLDASAEYRQALALAEDPDGMRALLAGRLTDEGVT